MSSIRVLPERVASQIAAGEVVERPASVVRELLDNSIDAGADRIEVGIEGGGKRLIRVRDNGGGMSRDDLLLCVERHATSKIASLEDLARIRSLGFRGEALPSIAAVSRLQIVSRPSTALFGHRLKLSGGRMVAIEETGAPPGTIVEVRDLFFNVPARRKFLRSARTEIEHLMDVFLRLALPFAEISFRLDEGARTALRFPATKTLRSRLAQILGSEAAGAMVKLRQSGEGLEVKGYLAPASFSRGRPDRVLVYVNNRNIRDRLVHRAIMEGYGQRLMKGRYPQAVVFIRMDPAAVDVNVHPAKQEVRFREGNQVFRFLAAAVDGALKASAVRTARVDHWPAWKRPEMRPGVEVADSGVLPWAAVDKGEALSRPPEQAVLESQPEPEILGQLAGTYILGADEAGLWILDQHAAHERILYETLQQAWHEARIETQQLLVPVTLELSLKEARVLQAKGHTLKRFGLEVEPFGGNTFLLRAVPAVLNRTVWQSFFAELLIKLAAGDMGEDKVPDTVLQVMACHGAIRAGQRLRMEEMRALVRQWARATLPEHCPHGRPVVKRFSYRDLEKMFKRIA